MTFIVILVPCSAPAAGTAATFQPVTSSYTSGQTVTYTCNDANGLLIAGDKSRTCQADGTWTGDTAVCEGMGNKDVILLYMSNHVSFTFISMLALASNHCARDWPPTTASYNPGWGCTWEELVGLC